jgi:hypothetical protein
MDITHSRRSFGQLVRRARNAGQLAYYHRAGDERRIALLKGGAWHVYERPARMVTYCAWCVDSAQLTAEAHAEGLTVSHGICPRHQAEWAAAGDARQAVTR